MRYAELSHVPVMAEEICELLSPGAGEVMLDATLGGGGHARALLSRCGASCSLIGLDRDPFALEVASSRLRDEFPGANLRFFCVPFSRLEEAVKVAGFSSVDVVVFDLGVSSMQLEDGERGFSFDLDGPLDMRMGEGCRFDASWVLNNLSEDEIASILWRYGQERWAKRIARAVVMRRKEAPIRTTGELVSLIREAIPKPAQRSCGKHPARRTFQALRIYVNDEMGELERGLEAALRLLSPGGRMAVISYHSLEDALVKRAFRGAAASGEYVLLTKKPLEPSEDEVSRNRRARSAKLRAIRRVGASGGRG